MTMTLYIKGHLEHELHHLEGFKKGLKARSMVCLGVGWINQNVGSAARLPQRQAETDGESQEWSNELQ